MIVSVAFYVAEPATLDETNKSIRAESARVILRTFITRWIRTSEQIGMNK